LSRVEPPHKGGFLLEVISLKKIKEEEFELFDLKVETIKGEAPFVCSHKTGDYFYVVGENLVFRKGMKFSMYSLAGLLPILPAKQRITSPTDWMSTDAVIACTDPNCGGLFKITRLKKRTFKHSQATIVPMRKGTEA